MNNKNGLFLIAGIVANQTIRVVSKNNSVALISVIPMSFFMKKGKPFLYGALAATAYNEILSPNQNAVKIKEAPIFFERFKGKINA